MAKPRSEIIADYTARRKQAGMHKVCVWLDQDTFEALEHLAARHGSKNKAVEAAIQTATQRRPSD